MRHLYVVIDCSRSMEDQDLKPNRLTSTLKVNSVADPSRGTPAFMWYMINCKAPSPFSFPLQLIEAFVDEYFDQNPISQVCLYNQEFCACFTLNCVQTLHSNPFSSCLNMAGSGEFTGG